MYKSCDDAGRQEHGAGVELSCVLHKAMGLHVWTHTWSGFVWLSVARTPLQQHTLALETGQGVRGQSLSSIRSKASGGEHAARRVLVRKGGENAASKHITKFLIRGGREISN